LSLQTRAQAAPGREKAGGGRVLPVDIGAGRQASVTEEARYMYAITRGLGPEALAHSTGLRDAGLEVVEHRGLAAVVSSVDLGEFGEDALRKNLERLEWLEEVVRVHDAVIRSTTALGPTAPMRLATICRGDDEVRRRVDEWFFALEQVLDHVEGRMEWSIVILVPSQTSAPDAACLGDEVHDALTSLSAASRRLPIQDPRLTGRSGTMLFHGAYLVDADSGPAFESHVRSLAEAHPALEISCRGPGAPYSFAMLEQR